MPIDVCRCARSRGVYALIAARSGFPDAWWKLGCCGGVVDPASLPDDVDALKRIMAGMAQDAVHARTLIEKLRFELARLKRAQLGTSFKKLNGRVEQLELAIEALETDAAEPWPQLRPSPRRSRARP